MITKHVVLQWSATANEWRDQETGIPVTGIAPPIPRPEFTDAKHPFDKSFNVTYEQVQKMIADAIEQYKEDERNSHYPYVTVDRVDDLITKAIDAHTYHSPYFWPPINGTANGLVEYSTMQRAIEHKVNDVFTSLSNVWTAIRRIEEMPWWKRW